MRGQATTVRTKTAVTGGLFAADGQATMQQPAVALSKRWRFRCFTDKQLGITNVHVVMFNRD